MNIARQVGGDLKPLISKDEMENVIAGFSASMTGSLKSEEEFLSNHGRRMNDILQQRLTQGLNDEKMKGSIFIEKYLKENAAAKRLDSGLVYHEIVPGLGQQVCAEFLSKYNCDFSRYSLLRIPLLQFTIMELSLMEKSLIVQLIEESPSSFH